MAHAMPSLFHILKRRRASSRSEGTRRTTRSGMMSPTQMTTTTSDHVGCHAARKKRSMQYSTPSAILTDGFIELWSTLRFVFLGCIVFLALAVLYGLAQETRSVHYVWPGVLFSLTAWMVLSLLFSLYVENAANYSVIYGSIGAIIVLLLWLYLSATMMIMGAEFNSVLMEMKTARS